MGGCAGQDSSSIRQAEGAQGGRAELGTGGAPAAGGPPQALAARLTAAGSSGALRSKALGISCAQIMFEIARPFLLAIGIGLLIGIEWERAHTDRQVRDPLGSRSFTLLALLGAVAS